MADPRWPHGSLAIGFRSVPDNATHLPPEPSDAPQRRSVLLCPGPRLMGAAVRFLLNGEEVCVAGAATTTLLDWLRERRREPRKVATRAIAAPAPSRCRASRMARSFTARRTPVSFFCRNCTARRCAPSRVCRGRMAPRIRGFCTPGIVMSLYAAHRVGRRDWNDVLAGNLCRCTGYAPILRAAEAAGAEIGRASCRERG